MLALYNANECLKHTQTRKEKGMDGLGGGGKNQKIICFPFFLSFDKKCKLLSTQVYCVCRTKGNPLMQKDQTGRKSPFPDRNKK
jgi:hypothetical protein